jgi:hypothetical protein
MAAASALALAGLAAPAAAQHHHPPGTHKPPSAPKKQPTKKAAAKKPIAKKSAKKAATAKKPAAKKRKVAPAKVRPSRPVAAEPQVPATSGAHHDRGGSHDVPVEQQAQPPAAAHGPDHSQMDHSTGHAPVDPPHAGHATAPGDPSHEGHAAPADARPGHDAPSGAEHAGHASTRGAFGRYDINREASGTSWQPDTSHHSGLHAMAGDWSLLAHGVLNRVYDHQGGPRGDDKLFPSGMLMGMARRPVGNGTLQFKGMLSPDPIMGKRGYPLLLASGETADGEEHLIDRQHPHDFFMELSASVSQNIGRDSSVFLYAGLPGEPAFGPPTFMHREAIMDSPEAPIAHHWLDSTHISFGVVTAGVVLGQVKIEASRFNGREPDQHRWNIETGPLDSTAIRVAWNPTRELSLQGSWGHFEEPEQLEPGVDQRRWSASLLYASEIASGWKVAGTLAWGRKTIDHHGDTWRDDAFVAEASLKHRGWTIFTRGEITENRELLDEDEEHGRAFRVGKISLGGVRDFRVADHLSLGAGALVSVNFVPDALAPLYGGDNPLGTMGFVRLKLD